MKNKLVKKNGILVTALILLLGTAISYSFTIGDDYDRNWNECLKKYRSEWGQPCTNCTYSSDIYQVYFKNVCEVNIDVLISIQEEKNTWNCFYFNDLAPEDTVSGHACRGTGKYLYWVKKAGDTNVTFPLCTEVNEQYKK